MANEKGQIPLPTSSKRLEKAQDKIQYVLKITNNSPTIGAIKQLAQAVEELSYIVGKNLNDKILK